MSEQDTSLLAANQAFYDAFSSRDFKAMAGLWSEDAEVACVHPGWDVLEGHDAVLGSWRDILANPANPAIACHNAHAHVHGELGFVLCHEVAPEGVLVATNIFHLEDGAWRMVHHQAGPTAIETQAPPSPTAPPTGTVH